jgi:hypothetical protein
MRYRTCIALMVAACQLTVPTFALCKNNNQQKEERVEIKYLVPKDDFERVSHDLHLDPDHPSETRVICFYDTASLTLFTRTPKVILRSRYSTSGDQKTDTTVKIRGGKLAGKGAKCEFDEVIGEDKVESCSLTDETQKVTEIQIANRGSDMKKIFDHDQEDFLRKAGLDLDWKTLVPFGPVEGVKIWKDVSAAGLKITVERWELLQRDGKSAQTLFEVSTKVVLSEEPQAKATLSKLLGATGRETQDEETKTKIVLDHFAGIGDAAARP